MRSTNPEVLERMTGASVATLPPLATDEPAAVVDGVKDHLPRSLVPSFD